MASDENAEKMPPQKNETEYLQNGADEEVVDTQKNKYLTFYIDGGEYGIEIYNVLEIIGIDEPTSVPHAPSYVKGIINLRGNIIPVVDIRIRFGKPEAEYTDRSCIVVTTYKALTIGIIVDSVSEVISIPQELMQPPPQVKEGQQNIFISNIGKIGENPKQLLDLEKLLIEDI